jgi:hypothetical protein
MKRFPWLRMRKKTDPELPLEPPFWFGNQSNGEYFRSATKRDWKIRKLILETADENARRVGMDRRDFLASAMGMCTSLWVFNYVSACSSDTAGRKASGLREGGVGGGGGGGADSGKDARYCVPKEAMFDESVACNVVSGHEFIFDIQTHWFKKDDLSKFQAYIDLFGALFNTTTEIAYINDMFCNSDTTMAALSSWPGIACTGVNALDGGVCGLPLSNDSNAASRDHINMDLSKKTQRIVNHCQVMAQDANGVQGQLELMEQVLCQHGVAAWKLYPGAKLPTPFTMDGPIGRAVIEKGIALGVPLFCIHKGLPIGAFFDVDLGNHPRDIGKIAKDYPEAKFIVYHSGICTGYPRTGPDGGTVDCSGAPPEGPYDPNETDPTGVNALIRSVLDNGIPPNSNVYGEIGSAFNQRGIYDNPTVAAHFFGKLMKYLGPDNVCWGTDCVIYGSPQRFIEAFRALEIPQSMRDQYGYPALDNSTDEGKANKAKIFGLNAAKAYGVDPEAKRCAIESCPVTALKQNIDGEFGPRRWSFEEPRGPKTRKEYIEDAYAAAALGRPA